MSRLCFRCAWLLYYFLLGVLSKAPLKHTLLKTFRMTYASVIFCGSILSLIFVRRNACFVKKSFWLGEAGPLAKEGHGSSRNQMSAQNSYTVTRFLSILQFVKVFCQVRNKVFCFSLTSNWCLLSWLSIHMPTGKLKSYPALRISKNN